MRQQKYALDEAELKPYFVLDNMVAAMFDTAGRLFGLGFVERRDLPDRITPTCAPTRCGPLGRVTGAARLIGIFLHDNFVRPGKRSRRLDEPVTGEQQMLDGEALPVVNNNNFSKGDPTLLCFDDAQTLFHEFGHGLHGLLSRVRYPSQSGTAVRADFVEFPSQVFEHWLEVPENPAPLRPALPHRRAPSRGPAAAAPGGAQLQPGFVTVE